MRTMYLMRTPRNKMKASPTLAPFFISDPSKYIVQYSWSTTAGGIWTGLLCNEISQHLGLDGHPGSIQNALTHHLECPLHDSSCGIMVLDDLTKREGHHDHHRM